MLHSAFPEQLKPMESLEKSRLLLLSNSASSLSITLSKNERLVNLDAAFSLLQLPSKTPTVAAVVVPLLAVIAFPLSLSHSLCLGLGLLSEARLFLAFMVSASFFPFNLELFAV